MHHRRAHKIKGPRHTLGIGVQIKVIGGVMKSHSPLYGFPVRRYKLDPGRRKTGTARLGSLLSSHRCSRWQAMHEVIRLMAEWGLLAVFVGVLLDEGGLPIPCFPILVVAGAATATGHFSLLVIILAVAAAVLADLLWYWAGKRFDAASCPCCAVRRRIPAFARPKTCSPGSVPGRCCLCAMCPAYPISRWRWRRSRRSLSRFVVLNTVGAAL